MHKFCRQAFSHRCQGLPGIVTQSPWFRSSSVRLESTVPPKPELPDLTTDVNIHEHKLTRPTGPPRKPKKLTRWKELETLKEDTKGSLIPETLRLMEQDEEFQITAKQLKELGQAKLTREERKKRQRALDNLGIPNFLRFWKQEQKKFGIEDPEKKLNRGIVHTMQLNIGIYCNQACNHCHVESSPRRKEMMDRETAERCMELLRNSPDVKVVDITGGAPELCSQFRYLVEEATNQGKEVIDRCNLTSLLEPGQEDTAEFLASRGVHVVASLPCYSSDNVNQQRGKGVFGKSIQSLINLNELGYGKPGTGLLLDLVYNPLGGYLPPPQEELEKKYKEELDANFGIVFNNLYAFTNFPIKRFADFLLRRNELDSYMELLVRNFNLNTMDKLMCRNMVSVDYRGRLYDCDLNQQLDMPLTPRVLANPPKDRNYATVFDVANVDELKHTAIVTDNHCFGCTAGMGSS